MADQGAIGGPNGRNNSEYQAVKFANVWQQLGTSPYVASPARGYANPVVWESWFATSLPAQYGQDRNGYITGVITIQTAVTPGARVFLHTGAGEFLATTFTNAAGVYRFDGLNKGYTDYTITVSDPTGQFNLGRLDNMTPY